MSFSKLFAVLRTEMPLVKSKFPRINSGGCGAFALFLSNELTKRNIKHKIVWIGDAFRGEEKKLGKKIHSIFNENGRPTLNHFNDNGIYLTHAMVVINGKFVDATGVYDKFDDTNWCYGNRSVLTKITNEQLKNLVASPEGWNPSFDRELMPRVKKQVEKILKPIESFEENGFINSLKKCLDI
jgi:hypothetical protein